MSDRIGELHRKTGETDVTARVNLDGTGETSIDTGIGFLDHLLTALCRHARIDVRLSCAGDLPVDDHHSAEDCALALGAAIDQALGDRRGIRRFGTAYAPLDEALARTVLDLSGRPHAELSLRIRRDQIGALAGENVSHVLRSIAIAARATLHVDLLRGFNDHHKAEAAFKSTALALREAVRRDGGSIPSTKGTLS